MQKIRIVTKVSKKIDNDNSEAVGNENVKVTGGALKPRLVVEREDVPATFGELAEVISGTANEAALIATLYEDYALAGIQPLKNEFAKIINPSEDKVAEYLEKMRAALANFTPLSLVTAGERATDKARKSDTVRDILTKTFSSPEEQLAAIRAAMAGA